MPPKQGTLNKYFENPSNSKSKSQQTTLAFNRAKDSQPSKDNGRVIEELTSEMNGVEGKITRDLDEDVEMVNDMNSKSDIEVKILPSKADRKGACVTHNGHGTPDIQAETKTIIDGKRHPTDTTKTTTQGLEAHDEDLDEEPVKKRARRGVPNRSMKSSALAANSNSKTANLKAPDDDPEPVSPKSEVNGNKTDQEEMNVVELNSDDAEEDIEAQSDDEESPEVAAKAREKMQSTLKSNEKTLFADWKPGERTPYAALCTTFALIESTKKRLLILSYCSLFLRQVLRLTPQDLLPTVQLMLNKLAADYAGIELGIGEALIMKAIGEATGRSLNVVKNDHTNIGDLGLVAAQSRMSQPTMFKPKPLTIKGVLDGLMDIALASGKNSQTQKIAGIKKLLSAADINTKAVDITKNKGGASETKFIIRFLESKLRLGLAEKTVLPSLAHAVVSYETEKQGKMVPSQEQLAKGEAILKKVYSELPDYGVIIPTMLEHGIFQLGEHCKMQPGVPVKPMLAKATKSISEVLDRFEGKDFTCEYKYDGERAQIHYVADDSPQQYSTTLPRSKVKKEKGLSAIFSRNSEDLSTKYPDILAKLNTWIKKETKSFVLDCETVAWDVEAKQLRPFQHLQTRKRKDVKVEDVKVKVCVFAFDILFYNGEAVVKKSLRERRELLHKAFTPVEGQFAFAQYGNLSDIEEIQTLLDESVKASCEGLMVKMLDTDESGYEPSRRSRNWLKVKKDYLDGHGDSLDLVVLGAYYGKGKRTNVYGSFLLACYNPSAQTFESICNIGTGFSEAKLEEVHSQLSEITIIRPKPFYSHSSVTKDQPDVWFEPRVVWEVLAAGLTLSPRYKAGVDVLADASGRGISLRFPRFLNGRPDKKPEDATESRMVMEFYKKQQSVGKDKGPSVDDDFDY